MKTPPQWAYELGSGESAGRADEDVRYWKAVAIWMADVLAATAAHQMMLKAVGRNEKERQARIAAMAADALQGNFRNMPMGRTIDIVVERLRRITDQQRA